MADREHHATQYIIDLLIHRIDPAMATEPTYTGVCDVCDADVSEASSTTHADDCALADLIVIRGEKSRRERLPSDRPNELTYTRLRDFLVGYANEDGVIQGDPSLIAHEAVLAGIAVSDEEEMKEQHPHVDPRDVRFARYPKGHARRVVSGDVVYSLGSKPSGSKGANVAFGTRGVVYEQPGYHSIRWDTGATCALMCGDTYMMSVSFDRPVCSYCHGTGVYEPTGSEPMHCPRHCTSDKAKKEIDHWCAQCEHNAEKEKKQ